ncbi:MAG TPA: VOC family protein [Vicinamibacterales bacterium]|nr:VOC family protein [Vicinamibacterales bacterium]
MRITPCISLVFNGECDAAFTLYQHCLEGSVTFRLTWGDSPMADQAPAEWRAKILHATLTVGGTALSGGDVLPGLYERPQGFQLQLNLDDAAAAERIFTQLADGGRVTVPLQQTFWAKRFGAVVDRFGIPWGINCGEEAAVP